MKLKTTHIIGFILVCMLSTACNFLTTKEDILAQQQPLPNTKALRQKALETLSKKVKFKDTLYVITAVSYGICGNDERFNGEKRILTAEEIKTHQEYVKANPYILDDNDETLANNYYQATTNIGNKTIITGSSFEHRTFESGKNRTQINQLKKPIYYIDLQIQHKDTVKATASKFKTDKQIEFILTRNDTLWNVL